MLSDHTYVNGPLAEFYGVQGPDGQRRRLGPRASSNPSQRVGLLTQASLLATMAKEDRTDPVRRGKFILNQILCRTVQPPPPEIVAMFKPLDLSKTAREQFTEHRTNEVCASCHNTIDPLGLPFEHYDGIGQWRDDDRGMEIDATGRSRRATDRAPVRRRARRWRGCWPTCPTRAPATWRSGCASPKGKLNSDADKAYIDWLMTRFTRNTRIIDLVAAIVGSDTFRYLAPADGAP